MFIIRGNCEERGTVGRYRFYVKVLIAGTGVTALLGIMGEDRDSLNVI